MLEQFHNEPGEVPSKTPLFLEQVGLSSEGRNEEYTRVFNTHRPELVALLAQAHIHTTVDTALETYAAKLAQVADLGRFFRYCLPYVEDYTPDQVEKFRSKFELVERLVWREPVSTGAGDFDTALEEVQNAYRAYLEQFSYPEYRQRFLDRKAELKGATKR